MSCSYDWNMEPLCESLINKLRTSIAETRDFLKPIFRWTKLGNKQYNMEKAFQFIEWMVRLTRQPDESLNIPVQSHVQPKYAYNTIVTMSQRSGNLECAERAYNRMLFYGYQPDVFTLTALLDVVGRKGSLQRALVIYSYMMTSHDTLPNIVSFVTLIGIAGYHSEKSYGASVLLNLYNDAKRLAHNGSSQSLIDLPSNRLELSLYNSLLASSVRLGDFFVAFIILKDFSHEFGVENALPPLTIKILAKLSLRILSTTLLTQIQDIQKTPSDEIISTDDIKLCNQDNCTTTDILRLHGILSHENAALVSDTAESYRLGITATDSAARTYTGCLGPDASEHLRKSVMTHDINKLIDRLQNRQCMCAYACNCNSSHNNLSNSSLLMTQDPDNDVDDVDGGLVESIQQSLSLTGLAISNHLTLDEESISNTGDAIDSKVYENEAIECDKTNAEGKDGNNPNLSAPTQTSTNTQLPYTHTLVENDFTTLLHQCRKRKWSDQIIYILQTMRNLAEIGLPDRSIRPQPHLNPTASSYETAFEGYFSMGLGVLAWELYEDIYERGELGNELSFITMIAKGLMHCGEPQLAVLVYINMRKAGLMPSRRLILGLLSGLGGSVELGVAVLCDAFVIAGDLAKEFDISAKEIRDCGLIGNDVSSQIDAECDVLQTMSFTLIDCFKFLSRLFESCAVLGYTSHVDKILSIIRNKQSFKVVISSKHLGTCNHSAFDNEHLDHGSGAVSYDSVRHIVVPQTLEITLGRLIDGLNPSFVIALLMAACNTGIPTDAHDWLFHWQRSKVIPPFPFLHTLVTEAFSAVSSTTPHLSQATLSTSMSSLPFSGFMRTGAVKHLEAQRPLLRRVLQVVRSERDSVYARGGMSRPDEGEEEDNMEVEDNCCAETKLEAVKDSVDEDLVPAHRHSHSKRDLYNEVDDDEPTDEEKTDCAAHTVKVKFYAQRLQHVEAEKQQYFDVTKSRVYKMMSTPYTVSDIRTSLDEGNVPINSIVVDNICLRALLPTEMISSESSDSDVDNDVLTMYYLSVASPLFSPHSDKNLSLCTSSTTSGDHDDFNYNYNTNTFLQDNNVKDSTASDIIPELAMLLLMHYIQARMSILRNKEAKIRLTTNCQAIIQYVSTGHEFNKCVSLVQVDPVIRFLCECMRVARALNLSARQQGKLLSLFFEPAAAVFMHQKKMNNINNNVTHNKTDEVHDHLAYAQIDPKLLLTSHNDIEQYLVRLAAVAQNTNVGLDIWRELHRAFDILLLEEARNYASNAVMALLLQNREKPIKLMQFLRQHSLCQDDKSVEAVESKLISNLMDDKSQWNALLFYLGDGNSASETGGTDGKKSKAGSHDVRHDNRRVVRVIRKMLNLASNPTSNDSSNTSLSPLLSADGPSPGSGSSPNVEVYSTCLRDWAGKLICRFDLADSLEFRGFMATTETMIAERNSQIYASHSQYDEHGVGREEQEKNQYFESPIGTDHILWVDSIETLNEAESELIGWKREVCSLQDNHVLDELCRNGLPSDGSRVLAVERAVGVDVEWRPFSTANPSTKCSLLQIACPARVFVFDLMVLESWDNPDISSSDDLVISSTLCTDSSLQVAFSCFLKKLLCHPQILKIGFGIANDLKRLRESYPGRVQYLDVGPTFDLSQASAVTGPDIGSNTDRSTLPNILSSMPCTIPCNGGRPASLSALCIEIFGKPLDKRMQRSDWQRRPLLLQQLQYAALDALVLLLIYQAEKKL